MPTAEWEESRCMHGNLPAICFVVYCRRPEIISGHQACQRNDLQELQKQNRDGCHHDRVADRLTPEEFELALGSAPSMGPLKLMPFERCPECQGMVPVRDESKPPLERSKLS
jgi:hypothetical protein